MTGPDLDRHRAHHALTNPEGAPWKPRGWLAAPLTALDGRQLGLIQAFDKQEGAFSELDEAVLTQLAQMASVAVDRAHLYQRTRPAPQETRTASSDQTVDPDANAK
jgi:GAF domain-containing protein